MIKRTQELLDNITKTSLSIKKLYNKLYELDANNLSDSEEYKITLDYLNIALECEKKYYSQIDRNEIDSIIDTLKFKLLYFNDIILDNLNSNDDKKLVNIRILSKLLEMTNSNNFISNIGFEDESLNSVFLMLINDRLEQLRNENTRDLSINSLLSIKYNLSFLVSNIEKLNIQQNFKNIDVVVFDNGNNIQSESNTINDLPSLFSMITDKFHKMFYINKMNYIMNLLLSFTDKDLKNMQKFTQYSFYTFYFRACSYFLNDKDAMDSIAYNFNDNIFMFLKNNNEIIIKSIRALLECFNSDKKYIDSKIYKIGNK